ncbi:MAG TPA: zinc-binding dehydrogenase [Dehalococcoidia bacterium]|nr:zinc-binding dehydrogenase [Dehalococcoidia bacterium]
MKAVVFEEHGGVEVLQYKEMAEPKVGPNDVLIKVRASGCNYNDVWARRGLPGVKFALPHISGSDAAGEVVDVGSEVADFKAGDEVMVYPGLSCRSCEFCASGRDTFCRQYKIWGFQTGPLDGAHGEFAKLPAFNIIPKPKALGWEEAASLPLVLLTAWRMLVGRARIEAGDYVLVWGAAGGLGTIAVQICRARGARAIAVAGSDEKLELCSKLGAEHLVNRKTQDVVEEVRKITNRRGVDVVFEHVGNATWPQSVASLKWGGSLVTCGATTGFEAVTDLRFLWNKQMNFMGSHMGNKTDLLEGMRWVESGHIKPVVSQAFPLREAGRAQTLMENSEVMGKIVLLPE